MRRVSAAVLCVVMIFWCGAALAGPPQGMLDQICSDEKTKQQLIVTWNTLEPNIVPYVEKYWRNPNELDTVNGG